MKPKKLLSFIQEAVKSGYDQKKPSPSKQILHRNRSKDFVESLANQLRLEYSNRSNVRVFSKHPQHINSVMQRREFGMNELLYDILVCDTDRTSAPKGAKELRYVTKSIWQIESELAKNSREAMYDFNKLTLGSSEFKLFIGPLTNGPMAFLESLSCAAQHCEGQLFLALVPHPADWSENEDAVSLWQFENRTWQNACP